MFSLTLVEGRLQLTKKRLGVFVEYSTFPDIYQNDEVIEINHIRADLINEETIKSQLSESNIILLILPNDKKKLKQTCLKANNIYVEKSRLTGLTKIQESTDSLIQVFNLIYH
jgi:hypothetical protein